MMIREPWVGASESYQRAYRILAAMAPSHVTPARFKRTRKGVQLVKPGSVSQEMRDFVAALDEGNEERVKYYILLNLHYLPDGEKHG